MVGNQTVSDRTVQVVFRKIDTLDRRRRRRISVMFLIVLMPY